MNLPSNKKRFIMIGIFLGVIVTFAVLMGSPMFGGYDIAR